MPAPRLGVTAVEHLVVAVQKDDRGGKPGQGGDLAQRLIDRGGIEAAGAHVHAHRQRLARRHGFDRGRHQPDRHVVDRLVAQILQRLQQRGPAGAGQAGDHQQAGRAIRIGSGCSGPGDRGHVCL
jgi:hypothetical protein